MWQPVDACREHCAHRAWNRAGAAPSSEPIASRLADELARLDHAAHLLLHLDDPDGCLQLAVRWMRDAFDADRVDAGFGAPRDLIYRPQVEALRSGRNVPSMVGRVK